MSKLCQYVWKNPQKTGKGNYIRCVNCGNSRITMIDDLSRCKRNCGEAGPAPQWKPKSKLGDWVEKRLRSIGITKRRYNRFLVFFYLRDPNDPRCLKCNKRQEQLNRFGDWVQQRKLWRLLARLLAALNARVA